jgi:hypothetical protein
VVLPRDRGVGYLPDDERMPPQQPAMWGIAQAGPVMVTTTNSTSPSVYASAAGLLNKS